MSELYQKAKKRIEDNRKNNSILQRYENDVMIQLMTKAMKNKETPFELPNRFLIEETLLNEKEVEDLLVALGCFPIVSSLASKRFNRFQIVLK